jgi:hypothetical protein
VCDEKEEEEEEEKKKNRCVEAVSINQRTTISYVTREPVAAHAPIMMFGCL